MESLRNSLPISRERLCEMAETIEVDISGCSNKEAYECLVGHCEVMYSELLRVVAGHESLAYPELNAFNEDQLEKCRACMVCFSLELETTYPIEDKAS